jgi:hypothetical protein
MTDDKQPALEIIFSGVYDCYFPSYLETSINVQSTCFTPFYSVTFSHHIIYSTSLMINTHAPYALVYYRDRDRQEVWGEAMYQSHWDIVQVQGSHLFVPWSPYLDFNCADFNKFLGTRLALFRLICLTRSLEPIFCHDPLLDDTYPCHHTCFVISLS